ncbi:MULTISPECIES: DUF423 domain-containing protein [Dyella]|uniref:DUF423 domain-containing protein n=2 Tax=Dyella TaxID=231454 RepID=A0A4R0YVX0_9GAMM|nr:MULTISPECIES: DUF423 domain-containing protein [Dyella]TBR38804.1 DUF423 domain-containing protein [Dyella terrae]TCI13605.1 DUF423 domain-containing protein [Dyella soli]
MRQPVSPAVGALAGLLGASGVALGAFGAHALQGVLDERGVELWRTAVNYHFWHALAFVLVALTAAGRARSVALAAFGWGVVLFSGSLYALALGAPRWCGAITPVGGVAFIAGWLALGRALTRRAGQE